MSRRKLINYYKAVKGMDKSVINLCGVFVDTDTRNMLDGKITVEQFVDFKFFSYMK